MNQKYLKILSIIPDYMMTDPKRDKIKEIYMENIDEVFEYYNARAEKDRLERGFRKVELYRNREILKKYITSSI